MSDATLPHGETPETAIISAIARGAALWAETGDPALARAADGLALWLARAMAAPDGDELTLDAALGLRPGSLQRARLARRDALLRNLARRHWPELRGRPLARAIETTFSRYEAAGYQRHRAAGQRPDGRAGDLFDVLRLGPVPRGSRLRDVLAG